MTPAGTIAQAQEWLKAAELGNQAKDWDHLGYEPDCEPCRLFNRGVEARTHIAALGPGAVELAEALRLKLCDQCCYPPEMCEGCKRAAVALAHFAEAVLGEKGEG